MLGGTCLQWNNPKKTYFRWSSCFSLTPTFSPPSQPYHTITVTIVIVSPPLSPLPQPMYWVEQCSPQKNMCTWNPGMWLYLHLCRYNQDEGILTGGRWALNPVWSVSLPGNENLETEKDTQGRKRQRLKWWINKLDAKDGWQPPEARGGMEGFHSGASDIDPPRPWPQTSSLQYLKEDFYCFKPPSMWHCITAALGNYYSSHHLNHPLTPTTISTTSLLIVTKKMTRITYFQANTGTYF